MLNIKEFSLKLKGESPLICHKWYRERGSKPKKEMSQQEMFQEALYEFPNGDGSKSRPCYGFPVAAFKQAAVRAARGISLTKVFAKGSFLVLGEENGLVKLEGKPVLREDVVKKNRKEDHIIRAEFPKWSVSLKILYNAGAIAEKDIRTLFEIAGREVGVGRMRPQVMRKDNELGVFGTFSITN